MAVVNLKGSLVMTLVDDASSQKNAEVSLNGGRIRCAIDTVEVNSNDSVNSTYLMHRLPSNARIMPGSKIMLDDLASSGTPTLDVGVFAYKSNLVNADDDDALNDGLSASVAGEHDMVKDIADWGLPLWDFVASETVDPFGLLDIKLTLKDSAINQAGTITSVVFYTID